VGFCSISFTFTAVARSAGGKGSPSVANHFGGITFAQHGSAPSGGPPRARGGAELSLSPTNGEIGRPNDKENNSPNLCFESVTARAEI